MEKTSQFKLIYVFRINDEAHKGCLKIGETTCGNKVTLAEKPNSEALKQAACKRIDQITKTAGIAYELLHTELALYTKDGKIVAFNDKEVHEVLTNSGVKKKDFGHKNQGTEWFVADLETVKKAIAARKQGEKSLKPGEITTTQSPIVLRPEQRQAVNMAKKRFQKISQVLWNAKMRFGKTLTTLQLFRELEYDNAIIITHRPTVKASWFEDFNKIFYDNKTLKPKYNYGAKDQGETLDNLKADAEKNGTRYVYFASLQDLRGSEIVGGNFDKNNLVFNTEWNLVIIDEADEGTQTELGKNVISALRKKNTKVLYLSGTPFNLLNDFDPEDVFNWGYTDEQAAKANWDSQHFGDPNPYIGLPRMNIRTYALGNEIKGYKDAEVEFNFREFFRVKENGNEFVHKDDVKKFLDLLCRSDVKSNYPFATKEWQDIFRHTLWIVPGVKEAKALSAMLQANDVFGNFEICNVAGNGDEDAENENALETVRKAIGDDPDQTRTITLSCGRLTRGTSIGAWTGVLMLAGSYKTAAQTYMQTIFRVQTPATINGRIKTEAYVFDFAPDRVLTVIAEVAQKTSKKQTRSTKTNATQAADEQTSTREGIADFIQFCPIIAVNGSETKPYDADQIFNQLKKISIERIITRGFDDPKLYNDKLLNLDDIALKEFEKLKGIIGTTPSLAKTKDIIINEEGFDNEGGSNSSTPKTPTPRAKDEEEEKRRKQRAAAISILRGISIRMPLMIYGAELAETERITIDNFTQIIDDDSWKEFMPKGVSKAEFKKFAKYYNADMFISVAERVRSQVKAADNLNIEERIDRLASLFECFRNPDKETVLTPWRVVNMHLGDTLGGWNFYNADYTQRLDVPRFVSHPNVTEATFCPQTAILEINSKTGLYPLYVAYSVYRQVKASSNRTIETADDKLALWDSVISENIFVVCKTKMAESITRRTLLGFRGKRANIKTFKKLTETIKQEPDKFIKQVAKGKDFWNANNNNHMKFNAIVGNPPYQEVVTQKSSSNGQKVSVSIFQHFQTISDQIGRYVSLIYPGMRWIHRSGKGMEQFGLAQINDPHLQKLIFFPDSTDLFDVVGIADGISIVLKDNTKIEKGFTYIYSKNGVDISIEAENPGEELFPLNPDDDKIVRKIDNIINKYSCLHDNILPRSLFSIESDFVEKNPALVRPYKKGDKFDKSTEIKLFTNDKSGKAGRARWYITNREVIKTGTEYLDKWKVIVSSANAGGQKRSNQLDVIDNYSAFGRSRVALKTFETEAEAKNFYKYVKSEIIRFAFLLTDEQLTSLAKKVPDLLDYSDENGIINYNKDVDEQLYELFGLDEENQQYIKRILAEKGRE